MNKKLENEYQLIVKKIKLEALASMLMLIVSIIIIFNTDSNVLKLLMTLSSLISLRFVSNCRNKIESKNIEYGYVKGVLEDYRYFLPFNIVFAMYGIFFISSGLYDLIMLDQFKFSLTFGLLSVSYPIFDKRRYFIKCGKQFLYIKNKKIAIQEIENIKINESYLLINKPLKPITISIEEFNTSQMKKNYDFIEDLDIYKS